LDEPIAAGGTGQPPSARIAAAGRLSVVETMSVVAQAGEALHGARLGGHCQLSAEYLTAMDAAAARMVE
jgi:hypothetical protein